MTDVVQTSTGANAVSAAATLKSSITDRALFYVREIVAFSFWTYAICKLFIFDIEVALINAIDPRYIWIAQYKFLILLASLSTILLVTKNKQLVIWAL
jgi:hypothetical protein